MGTSKQYEQMNGCLNHLYFLLKRMGVAEMTISENERNITWQGTDKVDEELLNTLCKSINNIYDNSRPKEMS